MINNNIILEGLWGVGKSLVAKEFTKKYSYQFIPEPSHLNDSKKSFLDLNSWYKDAHLKRESLLNTGKPCLLERSILSNFAYQYATEGTLPDKNELKRFSLVLSESSTLVVYLTPGNIPLMADQKNPNHIEEVLRVLRNKESIRRYESFYKTILPWEYGITPLILTAVDPTINRQLENIVSDIKICTEKERVAQVNIVCINQKEKAIPSILLMHRIPSRGDFWQTITGGLHIGEPLTAAATREVAEEIGIHIKQNELYPTGFSYSFLGGDGYILHEYVFAAIINSPDLIKISKEHDALFWAPPKEAYEKLKYDSNKNAVNAALGHIKKLDPDRYGSSYEVF